MTEIVGRERDEQETLSSSAKAILLCWLVRRISSSAWFLVILSAVLQVVIFPLPNLYWFSWIAVTPLLVAILRARAPETETLQLQLDGQMRLLPATPLQGFILGYFCGFSRLTGTSYGILHTVRHYRQ